MKFIIAFALIATVASAAIKPAQLSSDIAEIVAAIQSPSTNPATAAALEAMLLDVLGVSPTPIAVGPAIVDTSPIAVGPAIIESNPISVGPAIIDFPLPDGGLVTAVEPTPVVLPSPVVVPSPVVIGEIPTGSSPLVQIIVNVNGQQESIVAPVPTPVGTPVVEETYVPGPVNVVDSADISAPIVSPIVVVEPTVPGPVNVVDSADISAPVVSPIVVVEPTVPGPVNVVDGAIVEPVQVVNPIVVEPVQVGTPIIPAPAVVLPEQLN